MDMRNRSHAKTLNCSEVNREVEGEPEASFSYRVIMSRVYRRGRRSGADITRRT